MNIMRTDIDLLIDSLLAAVQNRPIVPDLTDAEVGRAATLVTELRRTRDGDASSMHPAGEITYKGEFRRLCM